MFDYVPEVFRSKYAETPEEADGWYTDPENHRRPPELLPRDEVARAINSEVKAGRGSPHGGVFLDIASRLPAEAIKSKLPSMYHQFMELAGVDITKEAMEVGPTCHYVMGGVLVEPDTGATVGVTGLFAAGEVAGGMHGSNRLGGNSLSDLLVFGRRAGVGASDYVETIGSHRPKITDTEISVAIDMALAPFKYGSGENPYEVQAELQQCMNDLVGIIRSGDEMSEAIEKIRDIRKKASVIEVTGDRRYNPAWHLALDLANMLLVSESIARSALEREESRGGHTRNDFPMMNPQLRGMNVLSRAIFDGNRVVRNGSTAIQVSQDEIPLLSAELAGLFEVDELDKYFSEGDLKKMGVKSESGART
jgi:succinate dehydrogenase / fumarate reductase flavoprotein subunit